MGKAYRRHDKDVMEELVPKATGREAMIEKRKEAAAKIHGASKAREEAKDGMEMSDSAMYGSGNDYQRRLQRKHEWEAKKQAEKDGRVQELQDKEKARMQGFMASLGIVPGQKITIKERD